MGKRRKHQRETEDIQPRKCWQTNDKKDSLEGSRGPTKTEISGYKQPGATPHWKDKTEREREGEQMYTCTPTPSRHTKPAQDIKNLSLAECS